MDDLWRTFANNVGSFALALILATVVWVVAANDTNRISEDIFPRSGGIEIELEGMAPGLVALSGDSERVQLYLRAPEASWNRLEPGDFRAWVDLSTDAAGRHQVEVQVSHLPPADPQVRVLRRDPDRITVELDEIITRTIPVTVELDDSGAIPFSYEVLTPTVEPPAVTLSGPSTILAQIEAAVARVVLGDARTTIVTSDRVSLVDRSGTQVRVDEVPGMRMEPAQVQVTVPVRQRPGYRELAVTPFIADRPADGYYLGDVDWEPRQISVVGLPATIEALPALVETEPILVGGERAGTITRNVQLDLPEDVSVIGSGAVTVTIEIGAQLNQRRFTVRPVPARLEAGLAAADLSAETVDVLVQGPVVELETLEASEVVASLDLNGLGVGTVLITPTIQVPSPFEVQGWFPEQVAVTIAQAQAERTFDRPAEIGGLPAELRAFVMPPTVTVGVTGPLLRINELEATDVAVMLDLSGREVGSYGLRPGISVPEGLTVTEVIPPQLAVEVYPADNTIVVTRTLSWTNLGEGLVLNLEPLEVSLQLRGPGSSATMENNAGLVASVDVAGLGAGQFTLRPQVVVPPGYELVAIIPEAVVATLSSE
ncbi:MAG TPA: CdaR family protein [Ardenticatenaceae bacterium]|nr:CdaR family protein [Ardenticatenaceae bacterium]